MKRSVAIAAGLVVLVACSSGSTGSGVKGTRAAGAACSVNEDCLSGVCNGDAVGTSGGGGGGGGGGEGERGMSPLRPQGACTAPVSSSGEAGDAGSGTGTGTDTSKRCASYQGKTCSECEPGDYCEPGSSASGIYCLRTCKSDADCGCGVKCTPNKWTSSAKITICSNGGL